MSHKPFAGVEGSLDKFARLGIFRRGLTLAMLIDIAGSLADGVQCLPTTLDAMPHELEYDAVERRLKSKAGRSTVKKLRGRVSIAEAEEVPPNGLRVHYRVVIEIEGGQRPACVAEVIGLHYR